MKHWIHERGSKGQEVKRIQKSLSIIVDGKFGLETEESVKDFQSSQGLAVDGKVGPKTREKMEIEIFSGIDISKWNTVKDWRKVKSSGLAEFCWIKSTEGNNYLCPMFKKHLSAAKQIQIPYGAYHFARPDLHSDPFNEVKNFIKHCPIEKGNLRPVLDFERAGEHNPVSIRNWVLTFLQEFEKQSGVRPIIYTGGNMTKYHLNGDTTGIDDYMLWHAYYSKKALKNGIKKDRLGGWREWTIWQWTAKGQIPGIPGKTDRNWLVGGIAAKEAILIS